MVAEDAARISWLIVVISSFSFSFFFFFSLLEGVGDNVCTVVGIFWVSVLMPVHLSKYSYVKLESQTHS
jgi:hypothetical protein